ncbi:MAG TPA: hypothetical protein DCO91_00500 [Microbacterium sp.]|jgi:hypothetical protein|nr:hypothetical protein [Microbacterium sp.]
MSGLARSFALAFPRERGADSHGSHTRHFRDATRRESDADAREIRGIPGFVGIFEVGRQETSREPPSFRSMHEGGDFTALEDNHNG